LLQQARVPASRLGAEDVVQNAFLKALMSQTIINQPRAYLHTIIERDVAAAGKSHRKQLAVEMARGRDVLELGSYADHDHALLVDNRLTITSFLNELAPEQRKAVYLAKGLAWTHEEAARHLGKRPGTIAAQVSTGLARLTQLAAAAWTGIVLLCGALVTHGGLRATGRPADPAQGHPPSVHVTMGHGIATWLVIGLLAFGIPVLPRLAVGLTRVIGLRIPFFVLGLAKIATSDATHAAWTAELHAIVKSPQRLWPAAFCKGMAFAVPIALSAGGRATVNTLSWLRPARQPASRERPSPARRYIRPKSATVALCVGLTGLATSAFAGMAPACFDDLYRDGQLRTWVQWAYSGGLALAIAMAFVLFSMTVFFRIAEARVRAKRGVGRM
jgi:DNA-directed RNA polymerase specialized sigma24 family protein